MIAGARYFQTIFGIDTEHRHSEQMFNSDAEREL